MDKLTKIEWGFVIIAGIFFALLVAFIPDCSSGSGRTTSNHQPSPPSGTITLYGICKPMYDEPVDCTASMFCLCELIEDMREAD